jgi:probable aminopeptidase NPEPL1
MPNMKTDMGGAAAVLAAFNAAVALGTQVELTAVLCIAENSVGPNATRPDDVLHMLSGKTVEVNNTDAEGRLVLADGVAWVARERNPDQVVDVATLTGAQGVATGQRVAAIITNRDALESTTVQVGRKTGELVHPLPFIPEFFQSEFSSTIADMRNSVKHRNNAQVSCAAQFIYSHLDATGYENEWLHIDLAAPSNANGRGTGFGVGLLLGLIDVI